MRCLARHPLPSSSWRRMMQHGWNWSRRGHPAARKQARGRCNLRADDVAAESDDGGGASDAPFVVCSNGPGQSGYQRRRDIAEELSIPMDHTQIVYNTDEESCFIVTSSATAMESYHSDLEQAHFDELDATHNNATASNSIRFGPLVDVLKLPKGTAANVLSNDDWAPPSIADFDELEAFSRRTVANEFSFDNSTEEVDVDIRKWSRSVMIELLPGSLEVDGSAEDVANGIVEYVKDMAQVSPDAGGGGSSSSSYLRSNSVNSRLETSVSTREAFSLTATDSNEDEYEGHNIWSDALANGFEAPHGCQVMLDTLEVRTRDSSSSGFDVLLHPPSQFMKRAAVESSAWNKHCALSLLMGLAVHPSVQTAEVGQPVELASIDVRSNMGNIGGMAEVQRRSHIRRHRKTMDAQDVQARRTPRSDEDLPEPRLDSNDSAVLPDLVDPDLVAHQDNFRSNDLTFLPGSLGGASTKKEGVTNPQWITQSGVVGSRPFFDVGLDGAGQVVAVADGGLDRDNCYFRDASPSERIFGEDGWDFGQRKVVHYDDSFGDRVEKGQGHGTYVSSIIAGKKSSDGTNEEVGHADGTAPGSSLAFFDMADGYDSIADPGVDRLLKSLYNPDASANDVERGARVINASWGRSYHGQYTSFCRLYDEALRSEYPDLLLVVSAGNTGRAGMQSIQDPADCKSPLAVGSTLSHGSDLRDGELGIEYLADYSSRGPTMDERIKVSRERSSRNGAVSCLTRPESESEQRHDDLFLSSRCSRYHSETTWLAAKDGAYKNSNLHFSTHDALTISSVSLLP